MQFFSRHIIIVNGYGCHLDTPLKPYLDRVTLFFNDVPSLAYPILLFSGGPTQQKSAPGVTEAGLMVEYVTKHRDRRIRPSEYHTEDTAFTTYYNIARSADLIRNVLPIVDPVNGHLFRSTKITIFCEATRSANVMMLARHFLLPFVESIDDMTVETASWERADPFKQAGNLIYNKLAITYPWLGLAEREQRRRMQRAKEI
ncbi:MAG: ElyC/SanA/YdcF family protein [Candidatus Paceibacterota bacterium]